LFGEALRQREEADEHFVLQPLLVSVAFAVRVEAGPVEAVLAVAADAGGAGTLAVLVPYAEIS